MAQGYIEVLGGRSEELCPRRGLYLGKKNSTTSPSNLVHSKWMGFSAQQALQCKALRKGTLA